MTNPHHSRRAFFLQGGATLGAGLAATAGAATLVPARAAPGAGAGRTDSEAIRELHHAFVAGVEAQRIPAAAATHLAYRANARQIDDKLQLGAGGTSATATWHVDVRVATPLQGDSTIAQMARLQGQLQDLRWEAGVLEASYERTQHGWRIATMHYRAT